MCSRPTDRGSCERAGSAEGRQAGRSGFTLLEAIIAVAFFLLTALALAHALLGATSLRESNRQRGAASDAVRSTVEEIQALARASLDAPGGWAQALTAALAPGAPLATFDVRGLAPLSGDESVGTVQVITDETVTDLMLGVPLGLPVDLDGDGEIASPDVSGTATLLPLVVRARWKGPAGASQVVKGFLVQGI